MADTDQSNPSVTLSRPRRTTSSPDDSDTSDTDSFIDDRSDTDKLDEDALSEGSAVLSERLYHEDEDGLANTDNQEEVLRDSLSKTVIDGL
jgi:hypothetical protein